MKSLLTILMLVACSGVLWAQENGIIQKGNDFYRSQQYDRAGAEYQKVLQDFPGNTTAKFNLANALVKQNKTDDAGKLLSELNVKETKPGLRSMADYNEGVILSQQKKLEESIEYYKEALRLNPNDKDARENLQKALLELKKKNPPKKQEEKKKKEETKQQPKPKLSQREAQQQLKLLEQKEKEVQERLQKNSTTGSSQPKDW